MVKSLKRIEQLDHKGCTIACVAMIVRMEYFELRHLLWSKRKEISYKMNGRNGFDGNIGFYHEETRGILLSLFKLDSEWIQFKGLANMDHHCILTLTTIDPTVIGHGGGHAVVFDAGQQKILNPGSRIIDNDLTTDTEVSFNVAYCLEIQ